MQTVDLKIYAKYDSNNSIIKVDSSIFIENTIDWVQIDKWKEGEDRYLYSHSSNGEYVLEKHGKPLYDNFGRPNFHDSFVEWTEEEKKEKYPIPKPQPSEIEKLQEENDLLKVQIQSLSDRNDFVEDCMAEMAMVIYA